VQLTPDEAHDSTAYPIFGDVPIADISREHVVRALAPIWTAQPATARKLQRRIAATLDYAAANGWRVADNPATGRVLRLTKALPTVNANGRRWPSLPWQRVPAFLAALDRQHGVSPLALRFAVLTALRSNEIRGARWNEFDFSDALWTIPGPRMGDATNTVFPWVVCDFGLTDAIESGLVKVPQLVAKDPSGQLLGAYFNIWAWIMPKLTAQERGTKRGSPKPEAILKYAHSPIAILGGMWSALLDEWAASDDPRPPVFILVAKNKKIAKALHEWIGDDIRPPGIAPLNVPALKNTDGKVVTIRVDTGVVHETDSGNAKSDESAWMRFTLDTVGRMAWPTDAQARPIYPEGFETLADKLKRPLHPPGRDVRCIVSVGMLTEGWDCNTVTHVVGLRPFQSQLLCEQVVGRALRRRSYDIGADGRLRWTTYNRIVERGEEAQEVRDDSFIGSAQRVIARANYRR
jgi:hypothetical protein